MVVHWGYFICRRRSITIALFVTIGFFPAVVINAVFEAAAVERTSLTEQEELGLEQRLAKRPLDLPSLLGKRLQEVVPGTAWSELGVAGEYSGHSIRLIVLRPLAPYALTWGFFNGDVCVSNYSMLILFLNRGYVFEVELRFMSDDYAGTSRGARNRNQPYCRDQTPIFDQLAMRLGGTIEGEGTERRVVYQTPRFVRLLYTRSGSSSLFWILRGGPVHNRHGL